MFVYFLQRKGFIDRGDLNYLQNKLAASKQRGKDRFFSEFLQALFFEAFAKLESDRDPKIQALVGKIKYLNGGLFLKHRIEREYPNIAIIDFNIMAGNSLIGLIRVNEESFDTVGNANILQRLDADNYRQILAEKNRSIELCKNHAFQAEEVGLESYKNGVTDETERSTIKAELDAIIAHLYALSETEFQHILSTFPLVPEETKQATLAAYKIFAPLTGDPEIIDLISQGESSQLEFKSSARWDLRENKKNKAMEQIILKTVAAFLNSQGGTLLNIRKRSRTIYRYNLSPSRKKRYLSH
jgi:hypothetical protein